MGLLSRGSPLSWEETKKRSEHVKKHGILQFISIYKKMKDKEDPMLKWGDEVEFTILAMDHDNKKARVALRASEVLKTLQEQKMPRFVWAPEYGAYMIEGVPGRPYGGFLYDFQKVEPDMKARRKEIGRYLKTNEIVVSMTSYPRLGCPGFTHPPLSCKSVTYFPREAITRTHPRYLTITKNTQDRRGEEFAVSLPIFKDKYTEGLIDGPGKLRKEGNKIVCKDSMDFGMGYCCLQVTFQACNLTEARTLFDQLAPLCPVLCTDCRTREERGLEPLRTSKFVIPKPRYSSISSYISDAGSGYNDTDLLLSQDHLNTLVESGVPDPLARHVAHLFIRDPLILFKENVGQDDASNIDHFENIHSTNWQSVRLKPPPYNSDIGWRVEFRPCEVQFTDFENAACVCFVALLTRVILSFRLSLLIPISKLDENMERCQEADAVKNRKFFFRKDPSGIADEVEEMTVSEIVNGKKNSFPGLVPLIEAYLNTVDSDAETHSKIHEYLDLISKRANGELQTEASWIRSFVRSHPSYKFDSVISDEVTYDLVSAIADIEKGVRKEPTLLNIYH